MNLTHAIESDMEYMQETSPAIRQQFKAYRNIHGVKD